MNSISPTYLSTVTRFETAIAMSMGMIAEKNLIVRIKKYEHLDFITAAVSLLRIPTNALFVMLRTVIE